MAYPSMGPLRLPLPLQARVEAAAHDLMSSDEIAVDFTAPAGAPALVEADSVSWRIFKNPISLFIGGVSAVLLELAEPRVRAGVWDHTSFRTDPVTRLRRTGLAAMVTVYASREVATAMIEGVNRRHALVTGVAETGEAYAADDTDLLDWVQATASFGFIQAYHRFARPLSDSERNRAWAEAAPAARLYGAVNAPISEAGWQTALTAMEPRLEPSPIIGEFLEIIRAAPALPAGARLLQPMLVRASVDLLPDALRSKLKLDGDRLTPQERPLVQAMGRAADSLVLQTAPPALASRRMGHAADWLYRQPAAPAA